MIGTSVIKELIEQIILGKKNGFFHPKEKEAIDTKKKIFFAATTRKTFYAKGEFAAKFVDLRNTKVYQRGLHDNITDL